MTDEQLVFDIESMLHESAIEAAPEWSGAPLSFTTAYWPPANLDAAHEHWLFLHKLDQSRIQSRMWRRAIAVPGKVAVGEHGFDLFTADLRCEPWTHREPHTGCQCVGELSYQATCEPHGWHVIAGDENSAVEGWHDHAFPGWRDLPIVPARLRSVDQPGLSKAARKWIAEHYPPSMQIIGAPPSSLSAAKAEPDTSQAAPPGRATTSPTRPWSPTGGSRSVGRVRRCANQLGRPRRALVPLSGLQRTTTNT